MTDTSKTCVVIGAWGGDREYFERVKNYLRDEYFYIYCDGGLSYADDYGRKPDMICGDFDSYEEWNENRHAYDDIRVDVLPRVKDETDSLYGAKMGIEAGFKEFILVGMVGGRLDHTLGNLGVLTYLWERDLRATIIDKYGIMEIVGKDGCEITDDFSYFSLIALNGEVSGVTITGAKYEVSDGSIKPSYQYGVSNEVLKGKTARVCVKEGAALLIRIF